MIKGNYVNKLLLSILIVMFLLGTCGVVDSVNNTDDIITNINSTPNEINTSGLIVVNSDGYVDSNNGASVIVPKSNDILYTDNKKTTRKKKKTTKKIKNDPTITVTGYPTCYTCWRNVRYHKVKTSYINYCPNCRKYGTLRNNPKHVADGEITCSRCDCDFCCYCGRDKVGSSGRHNWNILKKA